MTKGHNDTVEFEGERYLQIHGAWYNARTYIKPPAIISRQLTERFGAAEQTTNDPRRTPAASRQPATAAPSS